MSKPLGLPPGEDSTEGRSPDVCVLIPTFGAAKLLTGCLHSLLRYAPRNCTVYVLDDATPDDSIEAACRILPETPLSIRYVRSETNRGFVATCNWGLQNLWEPGMDLLLLNSDTEVTGGFLEEMQAVLHMHEKHAAVTPRSNYATIFSVPWNGGQMEPEQSFSIWNQLRRHLPRYHVVPTAVGFCMLIKGCILEEFGLFDDVYSPGYNEENDFVCRVNRFGYSAVSANQAFVFHYESASFGTRRAALDKARRAILTHRYPEYDRKIRDYLQYGIDPLENFAGLYSPHVPRVLFDLCHLPGQHCGTSEFALSLLRELATIAESGAYELYVGTNRIQSFFQNELRGYRLYDAGSPISMNFDLVFKPGQIFSWQEFSRMNKLAPRFAFTLLDIIAVRCEYLSSADQAIIFHNSVELADAVFTISRFSQSDYNAMYLSHPPTEVIHLGSKFHWGHRSSNSEKYVLVVGNNYAHKGVSDAVSALENDFPLVVLGALNGTTHGKVRFLESGQVNRRQVWELFAGARAVVYPSHYEGFGLPVIDSLALGTPVLVRDSAVNREIAGLAAGQAFYFASTKDLPKMLKSVLAADPAETVGPVRHWSDTAREYDAAFRALLQKNIDASKLRRRTAMLRMLEARGALG